MIDWESEESYLLANPAYSPQAKARYMKIINQGTDWPAHIWLATSGSTALKWVGLSKQAILFSAEAVNLHLQSDASDRWALALPRFHVGGLGILARSYLSHATVDDFNSAHSGKWEAEAFYDYLKMKKSTLTSLVPAQLYDIIQLKKKAPQTLRAIIIGGGQLLPELYFQAIELGWKVLPSYGLTECGSQVATASADNFDFYPYQSFKILSHVSVSIKNECIALKGPSLLSVYAFLNEEKVIFADPKIDGWFVSEDRGSVHADHLRISGRKDHMIKIGGENVNLASLEEVLQSLKIQNRIDSDMTLLAVPDERLGFTINLVVAGECLNSFDDMKEIFNKRVLPFERIRQVHRVKEFPKSALFKILRQDLLKMVLEAQRAVPKVDGS